MGSDGFPTPDRHDGMATFPGPRHNQVRLVRNHERGYSPVPFEGDGEQPLVGNPDFAYDRNSGGACTTLLFDTAAMRLVDSFISINGTSVNCAGGPTPQGSWLTCEETNNGPSTNLPRAQGFQEKHGYIFEVPAEGGVVKDPQPHGRWDALPTRPSPSTRPAESCTRPRTTAPPQASTPSFPPGPGS
ncbi:MAG: alkaline phosphatase PhoX [Acidimicrobiales bacterium]